MTRASAQLAARVALGMGQRSIDTDKSRGQRWWAAGAGRAEKKSVDPFCTRRSSDCLAVWLSGWLSGDR